MFIFLTLSQDDCKRWRYYQFVFNDFAAGEVFFPLIRQKSKFEISLMATNKQAAIISHSDE